MTTEYQKIADKWAWKFFSEKEDVSLTSQIQSAINEATERQSKVLADIAQKIDGTEEVSLNMSHGELQSLAEVQDALLTEIRGSIEEIEIESAPKDKES